VNTTKAMGELARDPDVRIEMEKLDGFRLVWSLLKHPSPLVQAGAAWAICPYVEKSENAGQMVQNYVGGLEAIVQLLASPDSDVQAAVAYAIGCIAQNRENLSIMSDHAVVEYLAKLAPTVRYLLKIFFDYLTV
jgi:HEAT repeat protein